MGGRYLPQWIGQVLLVSSVFITIYTIINYLPHLLVISASYVTSDINFTNICNATNTSGNFSGMTDQLQNLMPAYLAKHNVIRLLIFHAKEHLVWAFICLLLGFMLLAFTIWIVTMSTSSLRWLCINMVRYVFILLLWHMHNCDTFMRNIGLHENVKTCWFTAKSPGFPCISF